MVAMTRQIEAAVQGLLVQVHEKQYEMEVEGDEMKRSLMQREAEKEQAAKMKGWDAERKRERALFNAEMAGDLTEEGEQKLMDKLNAKKEELKSLRKAHDALEKEFNQLDEDFAEVRKVTGVNSLAEVVEKIKKQKENKKQLVLEKRDADSRLAGAKQMREKLEKRFSELRASGIGTTASAGGDKETEGALVLEDPSVDEMNVSLAPGNNLRIKSEEQKENEKSVKESVFLTAVDEDEADDGLAPGDPSELVPARSFIKKSAARQYESAIRAEAEKKRASKLEELSEGPGAAKGSKAARKKAQDEWLKEAGKPINNLHPLPMSKVKGCAQDRAAQLIRDFPKFG